MLHNFFLEEVEDYGANQVAKFARYDLIYKLFRMKCINI